MRVVEQNKIWQFDVDDTLILWSNESASPHIKIVSHTGIEVYLVPHYENINLLRKLYTVGWYIRVHSGSGWAWAESVVRGLGLEHYVDEVTSKPLGNTDDSPPGAGLAYNVYIDPITGKETA